MNLKPNLLIVDDLEMNLFLLERILQPLEVKLIKASSGFEAIEKARGNVFALAIVDVFMPEMNGFELAIKLNEERLDDKIPIIFLTANYNNETEIFNGYSSGAVDYLIKPVNSDILVSKVKVFLDLFNKNQAIVRNANQLKKSADELFRLNEALKLSEEKYRSYIDHAPHGVFITDNTGKFSEINAATSEISGYTKNELLEMTFSDVIQESSQKETNSHFKDLVNSEFRGSELIIKHQNRSERWISIDCVNLDGKKHLCFIQDITNRKKAEAELQSSLDQLHQLTRYVEKVRENERVAISRELHDDLGQALTAVKIDLGIIRQLVNNPDVIARINKVTQLIRDTINTVQRLTAQLRPQILDDLGLEAAMEWYTNDFAQRNGIEVFLHIDSGISLSPEVSLIVFRIMQESLTNISRYAKASRVNIELCRIDGSIDFIISDNGIGIKENEINSSKSFGLIGMKERSASLGGTFEIGRGLKNGTKIKINFPLNNN